MARTEEDMQLNDRAVRTYRTNRNRMLLAGSRARLPVYSPTGRNKRKKAAPVAKETKGREIEDSPSASKIGAEVKGTYGDSTSRTKRGRYSQDDKDRQPDRRVEGADKPARRSSEQLGIQWIGSYCPDKQPHFLISRHVYNIGNIFICRNCKKSIWLPFIIGEAAKLDGASSVRVFFSIILPLLRPFIIVVIILQTIASFKLFGQPYIITEGGPFNTTATPLMYIYDYLTTNIGIASTASIILFFIMLTVSFVEFFLISRGETVD